MTYDGLDEAELAGLTGAPAAHLYHSIPSVMDVAHRLAEAGADGGTVVLANEQTAGRGRAGRAWHSPLGAGVWLAIVLRPASPPGGTLPIRVALAIHDALDAAAPALLPCHKWPNDLVLHGRKLGGVLCEARWKGDQLGWIVTGIGLNVHGPVPGEVADIALAIRDVDPDATRLGILEELVPRVSALEDETGPLREEEIARYLASLWMPPGPGQPVGLDPDGALRVRTPDGRTHRRTDAP